MTLCSVRKPSATPGPVPGGQGQPRQGLKQGQPRWRGTPGDSQGSGEGSHLIWFLFVLREKSISPQLSCP